MAAVWGFCKSKNDVYEPDQDEAENGDAPKRMHGECGHVRPQIRKEGLELFLQYKRSKNDDDEEFEPSRPLNQINVYVFSRQRRSTMC
jgi:DNA-directed RNA polymerase II subunit RPB1